MRLQRVLAIVLCSCSAVTPEVVPVGQDAGTSEASAPPPKVAADPTQFVAGPALVAARQAHTATLLADGRVFIAGGEAADQSLLTSTEIFDPATNEITAGPSMPDARAQHSATLLASGKVLLVGGGHLNVIRAPDGTDVRGDALMFDPQAGAFARTPALHHARQAHVAVALLDGRVLVVGGGIDKNADVPLQGGATTGKLADATATAEIYEPRDNTWTEVAPMKSARFLHGAVLLKDGTVMVVGGATHVGQKSYNTTEIFDPQSLTFKDGPTLADERLRAATLAMSTGAVFVAAGKVSNTKFLKTGELLGVGQSSFTTVSIPIETGTAASIVLLQSGRALLSGGTYCPASGCVSSKAAATFDDRDGSWTPLADMARGRSLHQTTLLQDGRVLVTGGSDNATGKLVAGTELAEP